MRILSVLADETRLAVIQQLLAGPKHVGEINALLGLDQSLLSHHLQILRVGGLVVATRDGKHVRYRLAPSVARHYDGKSLNLGCCRLSFYG